MGVPVIPVFLTFASQGIMASLFKTGLLNKQLHEHTFARRTDVSQPRMGQPIDVTIKFIQVSPRAPLLELNQLSLPEGLRYPKNGTYL